jgi:hypothetical protein
MENDMTRMFALLCLLILMGCGVDGAPSAQTEGVTITGDARLGVVVNPNQIEGQP